MFLRRFVPAAAVIAAAGTFFVPVADGKVVVPGAGTNLAPNATFSGSTSWSLAAGAVYDDSVSFTGGSGSLKFSAQFADARAVVATTIGQRYTFSAMMLTTAVRQNVTMAVHDVSGVYPNIIQTFAGTNGPGVWEEVSFTFVAKFTSSYFLFSRYEVLAAATGDLWIDNVSITAGLQPQLPDATPKEAFNGSRNKVDSSGNWSYLNAAGQWVDWLPICASIDGRRTTYQPFGQAGFNASCHSGGYPDLMAKASAAGLRSFMQGGEFYSPGGWAYRNWAGLTNQINTVYAGPLANDFAGYWFDNEPPWGTSGDYATFCSTVDTADRLNGVRRSPQYQLQSGTFARSFCGDVYAAYDDGGSSQHVLMRATNSVRKPFVGCQINEAEGRMRTRVYACLAAGARMLSFWGDEDRPLTGRPWWPHFPTVANEIALMKPMLRTDSIAGITTSQATDVEPIAVGFKSYLGSEFVILSNVSNAQQSITITPGYGVSQVRDFFTDALVASPGASPSAFTITLPAGSNVAGTRVLKLVTSGAGPTTTVPVATTTTTIAPATTTTTTIAPTGTYDDKSSKFACSPEGGADTEATGWAVYGPGAPFDSGDHELTNHTTALAGATCTIRFTGTGLTLFGARGPNYGRLTVTYSAGALVIVDAYAAVPARNVPIFATGPLPLGNYTLTITATGNRNAASTGNFVVVDKVVVTGETSPVPPPPSTSTTTTKPATTTTRPPVTTTSIFFLRCVRTATKTTCTS